MAALFLTGGAGILRDIHVDIHKNGNDLLAQPIKGFSLNKIFRLSGGVLRFSKSDFVSRVSDTGKFSPSLFVRVRSRHALITTFGFLFFQYRTIRARHLHSIFIALASAFLSFER